MIVMMVMFARLIDVISFINAVMKIYKNAVNLSKSAMMSKFVPLILVTTIIVSIH